MSVVVGTLIASPLAAAQSRPATASQSKSLLDGSGASAAAVSSGTISTLVYPLYSPPETVGDAFNNLGPSGNPGDPWGINAVIGATVQSSGHQHVLLYALANSNVYEATVGKPGRTLLQIPGEVNASSEDTDMSLNPTGTQVVYNTENADLNIANVSAPYDATSLGVSGSDPTWSPNGHWIAYTNASDGISMISPDGTQLNGSTGPIVLDPNGTHPSWFPDSTMLADIESTQAEAPNSDVALVNINVAGSVTVTTLGVGFSSASTAIPFYGFYPNAVEVSPDGSSLAVLGRYQNCSVASTDGSIECGTAVPTSTWASETQAWELGIVPISGGPFSQSDVIANFGAACNGTFQVFDDTCANPDPNIVATTAHLTAWINSPNASGPPNPERSLQAQKSNAKQSFKAQLPNAALKCAQAASAVNGVVATASVLPEAGASGAALAQFGQAYVNDLEGAPQVQQSAQECANAGAGLISQYEIYENDPPDPDYTQIPVPQIGPPMTESVCGDQTGISSVECSNLDNLINQRESADELVDDIVAALNTASNRLYSASFAGDLGGVELEQAAMEALEGQYAAAATSLNAADAALADALNAQGVTVTFTSGGTSLGDGQLSDIAAADGLPANEFTAFAGSSIPTGSEDWATTLNQKLPTALSISTNEQASLSGVFGLFRAEVLQQVLPGSSISALAGDENAISGASKSAKRVKAWRQFVTDAASSGVEAGTLLAYAAAPLAKDSVLTLAAPVLTSIVVTPYDPTIASGTTEQFIATGNYSDGSTENLTSAVSWTTTDSAVATINASGLASGISTGFAAITATDGTVDSQGGLNVS